MAVGSANRNLVYLNMQATSESQELDRADVSRKRQKMIDNKVKSLEKGEQAGNIRGDAQDTQSAANAAAAGIGVAAAVCACFPPVGTIIAAVLAVIAAVIALVAYLSTKGSEQEAAALDEDAGLNDVKAEQLESDMEETKEEGRESRQVSQQQIQQLLQLEGEDRQNVKESLT